MPHPVTNIVAGYPESSIQMENQQLFIVCPDGRRNQWELKLSLSVAPQAVMPAYEQAERPVAAKLKKVTPRQ